MNSTCKLFLGLMAWSLLNIVAEARDGQCDGLPVERQSPIDIKTSTTKCSEMGSIYVPETTCNDVRLVNHAGHTAQLELDECDYTIESGPFVGQYSILQAHFHW
ncbi:unnamed protein product, partial [Owenia fusiformis]